LPMTHPTRSRRINLRASAPQETLIRAGAKVRGVNMTDFILESACTRAEQIIADQTTFTLSPQRWKAFTDALDRPPMLYPTPIQTASLRAFGSRKPLNGFAAA